MATPRVDLSQVSLLTEIVLRGGDFSDPRSRRSIKEQYTRPNRNYPDLQVGPSCLFRPGASLDELAREGFYPNLKLSATIIERLIGELANVGCELELYSTPNTFIPDHHTLIVLHNGVIETGLRDEVLDALIRAMVVVNNPYLRKKP